jgi:hypothetical protein
MSELHAYYSRVGFLNLRYRETDHLWGWFTPECASVADHFAVCEEGRLIFVVPYAVFCGGWRYVYADEYCVGQKTNSGKISEAYKWEERLASHGITPELIKKIKEFLERENKK